MRALMLFAILGMMIIPSSVIACRTNPPDVTDPTDEVDWSAHDVRCVADGRKDYVPDQPGRKKQSRENREKKKKDLGWKSRNPPREPPKHTPSKTHRKNG